MKEYNDYIGMTRQYLKRYHKLRITIENLEDEIKAQQASLASESMAIARYGDPQIGGSSELNATEAAAERRIKTEKRIEELLLNKAEIERILHMVDRALAGLNKTDRELVEGYYIDGYSWQQLGIKNYCTEKWARNKGNKALREVAFMIFGLVVKPQQLKFVFAR